MKNLRDYQDEEALDILADIIEPAVEIIGDKDVAAEWRKGNSVKCAVVAIKNHKKEVIQILARLEGMDVKDYHCNILTLPIQLVMLFNDKDLINFFNLQGQKEEKLSSGSATENTEEKEE